MATTGCNMVRIVDSTNCDVIVTYKGQQAQTGRDALVEEVANRPAGADVSPELNLPLAP